MQTRKVAAGINRALSFRFRDSTAPAHTSRACIMTPAAQQGFVGAATIRASEFVIGLQCPATFGSIPMSTDAQEGATQ